MDRQNAMTYQEAAVYLSTTVTALRAAASRGDITPIRLARSRYKVFDRAEIERYKQGKRARDRAEGARQAGQPAIQIPALALSAQVPPGWQDVVTAIGMWVAQALAAWIKNAEAAQENARSIAENARAIQNGLTSAVSAAIPKPQMPAGEAIGAALGKAIFDKLPTDEAATPEEWHKASDDAAQSVGAMFGLPVDRLAPLMHHLTDDIMRDAREHKELVISAKSA